MILMPFYNQLLGYQSNRFLEYLADLCFSGWSIHYSRFSGRQLSGLFPFRIFSHRGIKRKTQTGQRRDHFSVRHLLWFNSVFLYFLIIGTLIIIIQMKYVKNKNLGYDESQTVVIHIDNDDIYNHIELRLKRNYKITRISISVSMMSGEPGGFFDMFD